MLAAKTKELEEEEEGREAMEVEEERRFLTAVSEAIIVSPGSYLTSFIKGSPPRNGSN